MQVKSEGLGAQRTWVRDQLHRFLTVWTWENDFICVSSPFSVTD